MALATLIHGYSYLISLKIVVGYRTLRGSMNLCFSGGYQFFQILPGIKSLCDRGRKIIHLLTGRHNLGPER